MVYFEGISLTLPKLCSTRAGHEFFIAPIIKVFRVSLCFLSNIANMLNTVDILLIVAEDKIRRKLALNDIIKTLKEITLLSELKLNYVLYSKSLKVGGGKSFKLILDNRYRHLYWICLEKERENSNIICSGQHV